MQFYFKDKNKHPLEIYGGVLALVAGLGPRIWLVTKYPIEQTSDFANLLNFAQILKQNPFAPSEWWHFFVPGVPMLLSWVLNLFPFAAPNSVALWATAIVTGLIPLAPYLVWKNIFPWWVRFLSAMFLGIWFPQVLFSNILAQDNWVLLPAITLAALSIRALARPEQNFPIIGAVFYGLAVAIRQDALIVLMPLLLGAVIGQNRNISKILTSILKSALILVFIFGLLIFQRGVASGRYSLSSEHFGLTLAGAYAPGAGVGWVTPWEFIYRTHPTPIPQDEIEQVSRGLAVQEFFKRPSFHLVRMFASVYHYLTNMESLLWWSLPDGTSKAQQNFVSFHLLCTHILFLSSLTVLFQRRVAFKYTWALLLAILMKIGLHAATVSQARYFLIVLAFELLLIPLAAHVLWKEMSPKLVINSLLTGIAIYTLITTLGNSAVNYVLQNTWGITTDEFTMDPAPVTIQCKAENSTLMYITDTDVAFKLPTIEPVPGETAKVICTAQSQEAHQLFLSLKDDYAGGGFTNRIVYIVTSNEAQVLRHDMADGTFTGWVEAVELGRLDAASPLVFTVAIQAIQPDSGWEWGSFASTVFKLDVR